MAATCYDRPRDCNGSHARMHRSLDRHYAANDQCTSAWKPSVMKPRSYKRILKTVTIKTGQMIAYTPVFFAIYLHVLVLGYRHSKEDVKRDRQAA